MDREEYNNVATFYFIEGLKKGLAISGDEQTEWIIRLLEEIEDILVPVEENGK